MRSRRRIAGLGLLAALGITAVFAPVVGGGWCGDAPAGGTSVCQSFERSVIGLDTTLWLWLAALGVVSAVTLAALLRKRA